MATKEQLKEYVCQCLCQYPMECRGQCNTLREYQDMLNRRFCSTCLLDEMVDELEDQ